MLLSTIKLFILDLSRLVFLNNIILFLNTLLWMETRPKFLYFLLKNVLPTYLSEPIVMFFFNISTSLFIAEPHFDRLEDFIRVIGKNLPLAVTLVIIRSLPTSTCTSFLFHNQDLKELLEYLGNIELYMSSFLKDRSVFLNLAFLSLTFFMLYFCVDILYAILWCFSNYTKHTNYFVKLTYAF